MSFDEQTKIGDVLDEKVPTFFLQPLYYNGGRRKLPLFLFPLGTDSTSSDTLRLCWRCLMWSLHQGSLMPIGLSGSNTFQVNEVVLPFLVAVDSQRVMPPLNSPLSMIHVVMLVTAPICQGAGP